MNRNQQRKLNKAIEYIEDLIKEWVEDNQSKVIAKNDLEEALEALKEVDSYKRD